jgi:hypothetical protein
MHAASCTLKNENIVTRHMSHWAREAWPRKKAVQTLPACLSCTFSWCGWLVSPRSIDRSRTPSSQIETTIDRVTGRGDRERVHDQPTTHPTNHAALCTPSRTHNAHTHKTHTHTTHAKTNELHPLAAHCLLALTHAGKSSILNQNTTRSKFQLPNNFHPLLSPLSPSTRSPNPHLRSSRVPRVGPSVLLCFTILVRRSPSPPPTLRKRFTRTHPLSHFTVLLQVDTLARTHKPWSFSLVAARKVNRPLKMAS